MRAARIGRVLLRYRLDSLLDGTPAELKAKDPSGKLDVVFRNLTMKQ